MRFGTGMRVLGSVAIAAVVMFAVLERHAEAEVLDNIYRAVIFAKGGLYLGNKAVQGTTQASSPTPNRITASVSNGPGGTALQASALVYQFPAVGTSACEDSPALTYDGGNSGGVAAIQFGDALSMGMDQVLPQDDAGVVVTPYVFAINQVKFRYCNFVGRSFGLPDASYYIRTWSNQ